MSSPHVTHLITEYYDGTLSAAVLEKIKSHMVFCNACRRTFQEIKDNSVLLKSTPQVPPSKLLEQRIINSISKEMAAPHEAPAPPSKPKWTFSYRTLGLAATAILLVFFVRNVPKMVEETKRPESKQKAVVAPHSSVSEASKPAPQAPADEPKAEAKETAQQANAAPAKNEVAPWARGVGQERDALSGSADTVDKSRSDFRSAPAAAGRKMEAPVSELKAEKKALPEKSAESQPMQSKDFENELISGQFSSISQPLEKVISDQKTWEDYWNRHQKNLPQKSAVPVVDFANNDVILVFAGNQPSGGFRVEITRVLLTRWEDAPARVVRYQVLPPPSDALVTMVITQPFAIKLTPKAEGPTFFKRIR